jgi:predicted ester cyclase
MSPEENKKIVQKAFDAVNSQNIDLLDEIVTKDYSNPSMNIHSLEDFKNILKMQSRAFSDLKRDTIDFSAEGEKVWVRYHITGKHTGVYRGLDPTGSLLDFYSVSGYRIIGDNIVEGWSIVDFLSFFRQLGIVKYLGFPDEKKRY